MASPAEIMPWVPAEGFVAPNITALEGIARQLVQDYPGRGAEVMLDLDPSGFTPEQMRWGITNLYGTQHGTLEAGGKIVPQNEAPYLRHIDTLHYGPYSLAEPTPKNEGGRTKDFVTGGPVAHIVDRITQAGAKEVTILAGQRERAWQARGEGSVQEMYDVLAETTGVDVDELRRRSPFVQAEEAKRGEGWHGPYGSETEVARLVAEAVNFDNIDWAAYPVSETAAKIFVPSQTYRLEDGRPYTVPDRDTALYTYNLKNGNTVQILDATAVQTRGLPRPNTDSQLREATTELTWGDNERAGIVTSVPHVRAGVDGAIRAAQLMGDKIESVEIVTGPRAKGENAASYALGELTLTDKAHRRAKALIEGNDPDAPELAKL
jgi:hypothetical protein